MTQYIVSQEASEDLEEIVDYFLTRNIEAGERFVTQFNKKCQNLATFPNLGRIYAYFSPSLRGIPLDGYIIFYRALEDRIVIVRVVSGYRDLRALFS